MARPMRSDRSAASWPIPVERTSASPVYWTPVTRCSFSSFFIAQLGHERPADRPWTDQRCPTSARRLSQRSNTRPPSEAQQCQLVSHACKLQSVRPTARAIRLTNQRCWDAGMTATTLSPRMHEFSACTMLNNTSSTVVIVTSIALTSRQSVGTDNCF
jgi:hypothetical protein